MDRLGLTRTDLAERANLGKVTVDRLLRGDRAGSAYTLHKVLAALCLDLSELFRMELP